MGGYEHASTPLPETIRRWVPLCFRRSRQSPIRGRARSSYLRCPTLRVEPASVACRLVKAGLRVR